MKAFNEITLIDLDEKTNFLLNKGLLITNCNSVKDLSEDFHLRAEQNTLSSSLIILNGNSASLSEIEALIIDLKQLNYNFPIIILEKKPSLIKLKQYKQLGVVDCVDIKQPNDVLFIHIEKALKSFSKSFLNQKFTPYKVKIEKRIFDLVIAIPLVILLSPLFFLIFVLIKLESKGPLIYSQQRVGSGYKIFKFYKFRSMYLNADKMIDKLAKSGHYANQETVQVEVTKNSLTNNLLLIEDDNEIDEEELIISNKKKNAASFLKFDKDPRITKVGHWIRKSSLDELPQLFNVILGDISIVGNRPLPLYEAETLTNDQFSERFLAPAGITGLWQVTERGKKTTTSDSRRALDIEYAKKNSLWMDLKILAMTPKAMFQEEDV